MSEHRRTCADARPRIHLWQRQSGQCVWTMGPLGIASRPFDTPGDALNDALLDEHQQRGAVVIIEGSGA